MNSIFQKDLIW